MVRQGGVAEWQGSSSQRVYTGRLTRHGKADWRGRSCHSEAMVDWRGRSGHDETVVTHWRGRSGHDEAMVDWRGHGEVVVVDWQRSSSHGQW